MIEEVVYGGASLLKFDFCEPIPESPTGMVSSRAVFLSEHRL